MTATLQKANVYDKGTFRAEAFSFVCEDASSLYSSEAEYFVFPGFADVHVHLREPGFSYKETIRTGTLAAAHGGYTAVCSMANLKPVPDTLANLQVQRELIERDAAVLVKPMGAITVEEKGQAIADLEAMAPYVVAFSDDGVGVRDRALMWEAMQRAKALGRLIAAHCEDVTYPPEDPKSEWSEVERDIMLAADTGCGLHICHVSSKVSLELIRQAKRDGIDVTCETGPHYLLLDRTGRPDSGNWKMNPPLRDREDREALLLALCDGTVDMIATDHAPHSREEKQRGFAKSLNGIVGLECAFSVLYTDLVRNGRLLTLEALIDKMSTSPRKRFSLGGITPTPDNCTIFSLDTPHTVDPDTFCSMGRSTPFGGKQVYGTCMTTIYGGKTVWKNSMTEN